MLGSGMTVAQAAQLRPLKRSEYDRLVVAGCFDGERIELIQGALVYMSPHGPLHDGTLSILEGLLRRLLVGRALVRVQSSLAATDDSEPEPDIAVVPALDYRAQHPDRAFLIVEVAHSSVAHDRAKATVYAASKVEEYWIVNLVDHLLEVYRDPDGGAYRQKKRLTSQDSIQLQAFPDVRVKLGDFLS